MERSFVQRTVDVVIPAFNEEACIGRLIEALFARYARSRYRFEVIVVDDGSVDGTADAVKRYLGVYPVRLVSLTRNFGKEAALLAGLDRARGAATIVMDADLQHPLELIDRFLEQWEAGYDCVYGVRQDRRGEPLVKRVLAKLFYAVMNSGAEVPIVADALDFRLLDRAVVAALCSIRERVRFTKGLYAWLGFRSIGIRFAPPPRAAGGRSRFNAARLMRLAWDGMTSFSDLPLRAAGIIGAAAAVGAIAYALFIAAETIAYGIDVPGWATLTVAVTFLGGVQILFLGVLGSYVRNVFIETKHRPSYLVRELADGTAAALRPRSAPAEIEDAPERSARDGSVARTAAA